MADKNGDDCVTMSDQIAAAIPATSTKSLSENRLM
jgi:hypothetical protein